MSPIKGLSEVRRLPRIGKIRLGIKKVSQKTNREYPASTEYFVCPDEVKEIYGDKPKQLDVIIPVEDEEIWANQYYRQYSRTRGLICKGDGEKCRRMVDVNTGDIANRDSSEVAWMEELPCAGKNCPDYQNKACQEVMNLQFILPKVEGLGVWQIDTGSINSIMNVNSDAEMIRAMVGRVSWIPLTLSLEPTEVNNPDDGKKKTVYCMRLRYKGNAESLLRASEAPRRQLLLSAPVDDEAPEDRFLTDANPEKLDEIKGKAEDDIEDYFPDTTSPATKSKSKPPDGGEQGNVPGREELMAMEFADAGEFMTACKEHFNINRSTVDKEVPQYDLSNKAQRVKAWQEIVSIYYKE